MWIYDISRLMFSARRIQTGVDLFGVANWLRTLKEYHPIGNRLRKLCMMRSAIPQRQIRKVEGVFTFMNANKITKPLIVLQGAMMLAFQKLKAMK